MRNGNLNGNGQRAGAPEDLGESISDETAGRLRRLAGRIPPDELSEVWVFPPLDDVEGSDEFHLFTRRMGDGVFRVCAAEFAGDNGKTEARVTVYGAVPEARVPRLVAGFRDRLGDGREPLYLPIFGSLERWRLAVGADQPEDVRALEAAGAEAGAAANGSSNGATNGASNGTSAAGASTTATMLRVVASSA